MYKYIIYLFENTARNFEVDPENIIVSNIHIRVFLRLFNFE